MRYKKYISLWQELPNADGLLEESHFTRKERHEGREQAFTSFIETVRNKQRNIYKNLRNIGHGNGNGAEIFLLFSNGNILENSFYLVLHQNE
jgi:hypothetical protein